MTRDEPGLRDGLAPDPVVDDPEAVAKSVHRKALLMAAGLFFAVDRYGRRQEADRDRALALLEGELDGLARAGEGARHDRPGPQAPVNAAPTQESSRRVR